MKKLILILAFTLLSNNAMADCFCACINGRNQPICTGPLNIKPLCPPAICP